MLASGWFVHRGFGRRISVKEVGSVAKAILLCGRICCGKSTYAARLRQEHPAVVLSVDEIMLRLFGPYCGDLHDTYASRTQDFLLRKSLEILNAGVDVILDWGFWTVKSREAARAFYAAHHIPCQLHYLNTPEALWQQRVARRNRDITENGAEGYPVDRELAQKCSRLFEEPEAAEVDVWIDQ